MEPDEAKIIVEQLNGVILEGKLMHVKYKKVPKKKMDTKIQPRNSSCLVEPPKKQKLVQNSALREVLL